MNSVNICQSNNIFSLDPQAHSLVESFCKCPAAKSVLNDIGTSAKISVQTGNFPHHRFAYGPENSDVEIQIPSKNLKTTEALSNMVFEIFNVKGLREFKNWAAKASQGMVSMEDYAKGIEIQEFESKEAYDTLIKKCGNIFKIKPEPGTPNLETQLWNHEINCHTDKIRLRWIDSYKNTYCEKNPVDLKSCNVKREDFCDLYLLKNLPDLQRQLVEVSRICERLPNAPQSIKDFYGNKMDSLCHRIHEL